MVEDMFKLANTDLEATFLPIKLVHVKIEIKRVTA